MIVPDSPELMTEQQLIDRDYEAQKAMTELRRRNGDLMELLRSIDPEAWKRVTPESFELRINIVQEIINEAVGLHTYIDEDEVQVECRELWELGGRIKNYIINWEEERERRSQLAKARQAKSQP